MKLYLTLKKAEQTGQIREGDYIKRVITGTDKDGSPQYRYLRTQAEVDAWEEGKSKKEDQKNKLKDKPLKEKVKQEQKESKKKQETGESRKLLLDSKKDKKDKKTTKKSLFIGN